MVSYTQRSDNAKLLAVKIYNSLYQRGMPVWLDIEMDRLNEAAMKEGVQNSECVIAVITGDVPGIAKSAYFERRYCVNELRWARQLGVPIQPVVLAKDKTRINELLDQAPEDLKDLGKVDFIHLDESRPAYWKTGIDEVIKNIDDLKSRQRSRSTRSRC